MTTVERPTLISKDGREVPYNDGLNPDYWENPNDLERDPLTWADLGHTTETLVLSAAEKVGQAWRGARGMGRAAMEFLARDADTNLEREPRRRTRRSMGEQALGFSERFTTLRQRVIGSVAVRTMKSYLHISKHAAKRPSYFSRMMYKPRHAEVPFRSTPVEEYARPDVDIDDITQPIRTDLGIDILRIA